MKKAISLTIIICVLMAMMNVASYAAGNSAEEQFNVGMEYFNKADYEHAFSYFLISGEIKGYAPSQNMLGVCYRDGLGVEQDEEKATEYFMKAVEQENSDAVKNLSAMRDRKEVDYQSAMDLYFSGNYEDAETLFRKLGDYKRSLDFLVICEDALKREKQEKVKAAAPVINSITLDANNHPTITWDAVPNAKNYKVVSSEDNITFSNPVYSNSNQITRFINKEGKTYYYKVCAVFPDGTESEFSESKSITIVTRLKAPKITSITLDSDNHPQIGWTEVSGASAYEIHVSQNGSTFSRLAYAIKATEYTVKTNKPGTTYYYKIRAVAADRTEGEFSSARKIVIPAKTTPTSKPNTDGYIGTVRGEWSGEKVSLNDSRNGVYELSETIRNCRALTMTVMFSNFEGHPEGVYYLYGRSEHGHWNQLGEFELTSNRENTLVRQTFDFAEEKHITITAFAIALHERSRAYTGPWSFSNTLSITDVYIYE